MLKLRLAAPELVIDLAKIDSAEGRPGRRRRDRHRGDDPALPGRAPTRWWPSTLRCSRSASPRWPTRRSGIAARSAEPVPTPTRRATSRRRPWPWTRSSSSPDRAGNVGSPAADFYTDFFTTAVGDDEILVEVRVPKYTGWGSAYEKFVRVAQQWAIAGVAATVRTEGGTIAEARIGLTNMGTTPIRARSPSRRSSGSRWRPGRRRRADRHRGRHRPADRPQRRPGVPPAPGVGAGPPCRAGSGGRLGRGPDASLQRARPPR